MSMTHLNKLLETLLDLKGSDLHLQVGSAPVYRVNGELIYTDHPPTTEQEMGAFVAGLIGGRQMELDTLKGIDLSYALPGKARFRTNIFKQRGTYSIAMRAIPFKIPTMEELGIPSTMEELASRPHGLVLVTGATGTGKSTTLAAVIGYINEHRKAHIITIEDPIEFLHSNKKSLIDQRELGCDTPSFAKALTDALREDPDVILVGEMRDLETIAMALTAAETGHLVFATLHTNDVAQAIDRMVDVFPPHQQSQVRTQLSVSLQGVVSQVLVCKKDGSGRLAAFEILVANSAIRNLIKENKTAQIYHVIQTSQKEGMQLLKDSLRDLCNKRIITSEEAIKYIVDVPGFMRSLEPLDVLFKKVKIDVSLS
jgi:twitching motility protein PilT